MSKPHPLLAQSLSTLESHAPSRLRLVSDSQPSAKAESGAPVVNLDSVRQRKLVAMHAGLIDRQVRKTMSKVGFCCEEAEVRSAAWVGFLEAVRRYDASRGIPFEAFALHRIQGAILDELRSRDQLRRLARHRARQVSAARERLLRQLQREPSEQELARAAGEDLETYRSRTARERAQSFLSLETLSEQGWEDTIAADRASPAEALCTHELQGALEAALRELPERQRHIVTQYYQEERSYREIGQDLGVTESRVCQLLKKVQRSLREQLSAHAA